MEENDLNEGQLPDVENTSDEIRSDDKTGIIKFFNSTLKRLQANEKLYSVLRIILFIFIPVLIFFSLITFVLYFVPALQEIKSGQKTEISSDPELKKDAGYKKQIALITKDIQRLSRKYNAYTSGQSYTVINTTENRFFLYRNKKLVREGSCSTGSYKKLLTAEGRSWTFKTPRGKFSIQGKRTNPAWHKPDWAFIEEGLPIPPKDSPLRWESGVLGDYAMDLGDSYMIHGTIYKRFLGMPVTHGCVRLNDEDLKAVYNTLNIGSKVYIF